MSRGRGRYVVAGAALLVAVAAIAVLVAQGLGLGQPLTATGIVIDVQSDSAVDITGFTLRTADGQLEHYLVGRLDTASPAFPSVHLRSHLISLIPIVVTYEMDGDQRVAVRMVDALLPASTATPLVTSSARARSPSPG
ncbi:MAG: hypothetical protein ACHQZR_07500 [Candidatus Limnocylindrales bacterium]